MSRRKKKIDVYTLEKEYVTTVEGVMAAATFCKVTQPNVSQHLHGRFSSCGGYVLKERKE